MKYIHKTYLRCFVHSGRITDGMENTVVQSKNEDKRLRSSCPMRSLDWLEDAKEHSLYEAKWLAKHRGFLRDK